MCRNSYFSTIKIIERTFAIESLLCLQTGHTAECFQIKRELDIGRKYWTEFFEYIMGRNPIYF